MLERDQTHNDIWDRIERLEEQMQDLRDMSRPTDVVILEGEWQSFAGWISDGTVLQDINGQIILDPSEPCILVGADGYIQSQDYVPGVSGWRIDGTGADLVDVEIPTVAPGFTFSTAAAEGAAGTFVRSDATLAIFDANNPVQIDAGDAANPGAAGVAARRDHAHAVNSTADGDTNHSTLLQSDANGRVRLAGLGIGVAAGADNQITLVDGGTIGQAAGPLLTFDDSNNYLEITGAYVGIGIAAPDYILHAQDNSSADVRIRLDNTKAADTSNYAMLTLGAMTDAQARPSLTAQAGFSDTADATRTSKVFFRTWDGGSGQYTISLLGHQVSVGHITAYGFLDVRQSTTTGPTIYAYRNLASGSTDSPVLSVVQDQAGDDQAAVYVQQDGTGDLLYLTGTGMTTQVTASGRLGVGMSPSAGVQIRTSSTLQALIAQTTGDAMVAQFLRDVASATNAVINVEQQNAAGLRPVINLRQVDVDKPFIQFTDGTIYTGKSAEDEYLMVLNPDGNTRYLKLYS